MEVKKEKGQIVLLDACTLINILYIDEDEIIIKLLKKLNFFIVEKVYIETKKNLFARLTSEQKFDSVFKEKLCSKLRHLSSHIIKNDKIIGLANPDFINDSSKVFEFKNKDDGEFYSSIYSLFISRFYNSKIIFYTDDYPARQHCSECFKFQQIGYVEDVVDLLVFLSTMSKLFTTIMLNNFFTSILSSYNSQIVSFRKELEKFRNGLTIQQKRDSDLRENLTSLLNKLSTFELDEIKKYRNKFNKRKYPILNTILKNNDSVFDINSESRKTMIEKVNNTIKSLEKQKLYKI